MVYLYFQMWQRLPLYKKLSDEAAKRMYKTVNGNKEYINPYTKEQVDALLHSRNIKIERNKLYDSVYVAKHVQG